MFRFIISTAALCAITYAATTVASTGTTLGHLDANILYDFHHSKGMIVRADGCYEYHMNHQDVLDAQNDATRPALEARMLQELSQAISVTETGHNHINHMTQEIRTACANLPVYQFDIAN